MKIKKIKINNFGKLNNKEISFDKNITLIYGKNEAGKTTLLKFILGMFYGISKNKNGKEFSDFDRYTPWKGEEFSGNIEYELDNNKKYEVYRDFTKKNPQIICDNKDISKEFNIDKTKGNEFFIEQTKIDEQLFLNTSLVEQQGVKLTSQNQQALTQKIANIISTGEENTSYKKVIEKLNKKLLEEIGTERSIGRPINIINSEIRRLEEKRENIKDQEQKKKQINEEIKTYLANLSEKENEFNTKKEIKKHIEKQNIEREKISINEKIKNENNLKIEELKKQKIENKIANKKNTEKITLVFLIILILATIFIPIKGIVKYSILAVFAILAIIDIFKTINRKNNEKNKKEETKRNNLKILNEIEILEKQNEQKNNEIKNIKLQIENDINLEKSKWTNKTNNIDNILNMDFNQLNNNIESLEREINSLKIQINILEMQEKSTEKELENKPEIEEKLLNYKKEEQELIKKENLINKAKQLLETSYEKMKEEITPHFTKNISNISSKITEGKYESVIFDENEGLLVKLETGEQIPASKLSVGTIEQLYLALRLSSSQEISEEKMPIILDEAFAYYDDSRLENILKFLNEYYKDLQVIIFTCSKREKEILEKLNIEYQEVEL